VAFSADNGGPVYWSIDKAWNGGGGANNWPLLGGKASNWEGGVRVAAFVSGGLVPAAMRGAKLEGYVHIADWFSTFCGLAGVDPTDTSAAAHGLPPIDSLDLWPMISGANTTSPRAEMALMVDVEKRDRKGANVSMIIVGKYKYLQGHQMQSFWQGPAFPNASYEFAKPTDFKYIKNCGPGAGPRAGADGCLYDILGDPTEQHDLAAEMPQVVVDMKEKLDAARKTKFQSADDDQTDACLAQVKANGGFYGPWLA